MSSIEQITTKPLSKQASQQEKLSEKVESLETALQTLKKAADIAVLEVKAIKKQLLKLKAQKPKKATIQLLDANNSRVCAVYPKINPVFI